jgi:hypothetical protein
MKAFTRQARIAQDIFERDERVAKDAAQSWVIGEARAKAPYSYAELRAAVKGPGAGEAVKALLATVAPDLIRLQAIRFVVERSEAHPEQWWGWDTVEEIEARFHRAAAEGIATARRRAAADAAQSAELAPHTYGELAEAEREGTLGFVLSDLAPDLYEAQALRWLVGRKAATGAAWTWDDVRSEAQRFAALASDWRRCLRDSLPDSLPDDDTTDVDVRDEAGDAGTQEARLLAVLATLECEAAAAADAAKADGDLELARIAKRSAQACRDAAGIVAHGGWIDDGSGSLLVASRSRRGVYHRVERDESGRVRCSCPWSAGERKIGPCAHQALFDAMERIK